MSLFTYESQYVMDGRIVRTRYFNTDCIMYGGTIRSPDDWFVKTWEDGSVNSHHLTPNQYIQLMYAVVGIHTVTLNGSPQWRPNGKSAPPVVAVTSAPPVEPRLQPHQLASRKARPYPSRALHVGHHRPAYARQATKI